MLLSYLFGSVKLSNLIMRMFLDHCQLYPSFNCPWDMERLGATVSLFFLLLGTTCHLTDYCPFVLCREVRRFMGVLSCQANTESGAPVLSIQMVANGFAASLSWHGKRLVSSIVLVSISVTR